MPAFESKSTKSVNESRAPTPTEHNAPKHDDYISQAEHDTTRAITSTCNPVPPRTISISFAKKAAGMTLRHTSWETVRKHLDSRFDFAEFRSRQHNVSDL